MHKTTTVSIEADDGGSFGAHVALPDAGHGPGVLVIQEVFGVNDYVKDVADRLAGLGYVALAPDAFWRIEEGFNVDSSDPANIEVAVGVAGQWDPEQGLADLSAAFAHLKAMDEVTGPVGVIGFCFGGTQAYRLAAALEPACVVSYYGSGIADLAADMADITCPIVFHFGDADPYIPNDQVDAIRAAAAANPHATVHVHAGGGHAFDNHFAPHFSQPELAAAAWTETGSFLFMHLGGPVMGA